MSARRVFMTGARGLLGSEHLRRILAWEPASEVTALLRGVDDEVVTGQGAALLKDLFVDPEARADAQARVRFVRGDVSAPGLGLAAHLLDELAQTTTDIVHSAADVRFHLPLEEARAVNLEGTRHVLELAEAATRAGVLRRLSHVSTYAVGRPEPGSDAVLEALPALEATYPNTYEQTKTEAEHLVLARAGEVPLVILRPSIIAGDSRTGWTLDFKVFYLPLRMYARGAFPPGRPFPVVRGARWDAVYLDFVSDRTYALSVLGADRSGTIYHVVAGDEAVETGPEFREGAQNLRELMALHGQRPPPPLEFEEVEALDRDALRRYLADARLFELIEPLLPYFSRPLLYDDRNTRAALSGHPLARRLDDAGSRRRLVEYCLTSQWGRRPGPRPPLLDPRATVA